MKKFNEKNFKMNEFNFRKIFQIFILTVFLIFPFVSCESSKKDFKYNDFSSINNRDNPKIPIIQIDEVEVISGGVENKNVSEQIENICNLHIFKMNKKKLYKNSSKEKCDVFFTLKIYEQPFLQNLENYNSVLATVILKDKNISDDSEKIIYQNNFYVKTKSSIFSSVFQKSFLEKIFFDLNNF